MCRIEREQKLVSFEYIPLGVSSVRAISIFMSKKEAKKKLRILAKQETHTQSRGSS